MSARMMLASRRDPMAGARRLHNANDPRLEEVIAHVNRNTDLIHGWRANNISIRANHMPLSGTLAVEKGRHVRLLVKSPLGTEVDLGSNDDCFWVWSKRMDPAYVTCKHENMDLARQSMGIPFEPDWLMEALGVEPLPTAGVTMEADPSNQQVRLVQQVTTARGRPLRRVVLVDLKKGKGVVVEHCLYDYFGKRIAMARLSGHRLDKKSGAVLPHRVTIDWPQNQMQLVLDLGSIDVNPRSTSNDLWTLPDLPGYEVVSLDAGSTQLASDVQLEEIDSVPQIDRRRIASADDDSESADSLPSGYSRIADEPDETDEPNDEVAKPADDDNW